MKKFYVILAVFLFLIEANAQVGIGTATPHQSAQLDVSSTEKGLLLPRMTKAQRTGIASPAMGLLVFQTDLEIGLYYYNGGSWVGLFANNPIASNPLPSNPPATVTNLAGSGSRGFADGYGAAASFNSPAGLAVDNRGNIYVADQGNHTIRKITPGGAVSTFAGEAGLAGWADGWGQNGVKFNQPAAMVYDPKSDLLYVADMGNNRIRSIDRGGIVKTVAGTGAIGAVDGPALTATFNAPMGLAIHEDVLYVADSKNNKIRSIRIIDADYERYFADVATVAGTGQPGKIDGAALAATFSNPTGLQVDAEGIVYVVDQGNHLIRKIVGSYDYMGDSVKRDVSIFAGDRRLGPGYRDGNLLSAQFFDPAAMTADFGNGNLYVADMRYNLIRIVSLFSGKVGTLAGGGSGSISDSSGEDVGTVNEAGVFSIFNAPAGVVLSGGYLYVSDKNGHKIQRVKLP